MILIMACVFSAINTSYTITNRNYKLIKYVLIDRHWTNLDKIWLQIVIGHSCREFLAVRLFLRSIDLIPLGSVGSFCLLRQMFDLFNGIVSC